MASFPVPDKEPQLRPYSIRFQGSVDALQDVVEAGGGRMYVLPDRGRSVREAVAVLPAEITLVAGAVTGRRHATCFVLGISALYLPY